MRFDIWDNLESVQKVSKQAAWWTVVLAFMAGIAGLISLMTALSPLFAVTSIVLAFASGSAGLVALVADKRKETLEEEFKKTPPGIDVNIKTGKEDNQFYVVIEPLNNIPFEQQWVIVTRNDKIVSGIPLEWGKIIPGSKQTFLRRANIELARVVDKYIELRFDYRSIFASEFPDLTLSGRLIKRYTLSPDNRFCIPIDG